MSQFNQVPVLAPQRNSFDLTHEHTTSCDAGYIVPIMCVEMLPSSTYYYSPKVLVRANPMTAPGYTKSNVTTVTMFVPNRILWKNSEKFFENPVPNGSTPVPPRFDNINVGVGTLHDYLGVPTQQFRNDSFDIQNQYVTLSDISALPSAAYQKIYNDWFRDENLVNNGNETFVPLVDGANDFSTYNVLRLRAWRHDYFTSCLPFAQKGEAVTIPLGEIAPVVLSGNNNPARVKLTAGNFPGSSFTTLEASNTSFGSSPSASFGAAGIGSAQLDPNGTLIADLSEASAVSINTLRWATRLQEFLEKNARGGSRYTEIVRQHFNQTSSDSRLQRAEFLGFSVEPLIYSEVLATSSTDNTDPESRGPLGEMGGHGISYGVGKKVRYHAEEHGFLMTVMIIRPRSSYMQGIPKMFRRKSPLDYAWPTFASLGEQEVKKWELYASGEGSDNETFGYLPRYAEYRSQHDRISGQMRTFYTHWHQARIFTAQPNLNEAFINCFPSKRIFAVQDAAFHCYLVHITNELSSEQPLPKFGIPSL